VLEPDGRVLSATTGAAGRTLLTSSQASMAAVRPLTITPGHLLTGGRRRVRVYAFPLAGGSVGVIAVPTATRDEALRELLAQLSIANGLALALAGLIGYRLARAALLPVEGYRRDAEAIANGDRGVRLVVPDGVDDEITRLGHTLNRMLDAEEASIRAQRQFVADASHELRSPLTHLRTRLELAQRQPRSLAEHVETLAEASVDTERLAVLAEQLLNLEQASSGPLPDADSCDVAAVVNGWCQATRLDPDRHWSVHVPPGPAALIGPTQLTQIVTNLVENAVRHGAGDIVIAAHLAESCWTLQVTDQGESLDPTFVPHAVDRFRRADTSRTTPGNGLGMALVHALVHQAQGELRMCRAGHHTFPPARFSAVACRHPATGTTVSVLLPALVTAPL